MTPLPNTRVALSLSLLVLLGAAPAEASPQVPNVEMRLLDGGPEEDGRQLAGVEIRIDDGWKTYWRHPGDSGLAPRFDFSESVNVGAIDLQWPAPSISHNGYGWVFGYRHEVVIPLVITPEDPDLPVELVLNLDYAVCAEICVPLQAEDGRALGRGGERAIIDFYRELVPPPTQEKADRGVREIKRISGPEGPMLELVVDLNGADDPRLVVEGPEAWLFSVPEIASRNEDGTTIFRAPAAEVLPAQPQREVELTVTGLADGITFEQRVILQ